MDKLNKTLEILAENWIWSIIVIMLITSMVSDIFQSFSPSKELKQRIELLESRIDKLERN